LPVSTIRAASARLSGAPIWASSGNIAFGDWRIIASIEDRNIRILGRADRQPSGSLSVKNRRHRQTVLDCRHGACEVVKVDRINACERGPDEPSISVLALQRRLRPDRRTRAGALLAERSRARAIGHPRRLARRTAFAAAISPNRAIITFLGHSSYQIDTAAGRARHHRLNGVNGFGRKPTS